MNRFLSNFNIQNFSKIKPNIFDNFYEMNITKNQVKPLFKNSRYISGLFLLLILFFSNPSFGQTADDAKNFAQCKACHTIGGGKLVGPDLKGITERRDEAWLIKFIQNSQALVAAGDETAVKVFNENSKIPMPAHNLTDDQVKGILKYIAAGGKLPGGAVTKTPAKTGETSIQKISEAEKYIQEKREGSRKLAIFAIISAVLVVVLLIDLIFTNFIKARWISYIFLLSSLWILGEWSWDVATDLGRQQTYQPDQPIWFSHKVHAGQNKIDCEYCHFTAERSMHAGIPPASVCMNCHAQVKEGKQTGKKEIAKIYKALDDKKPIEWIKVHNLPDFVYFNHEQHVKVGKLDCTECHGDVEQMDQIAQVNTLSMGWCLDCHRTRNVQFTDNKFYGSYKKFHEDMKAGKIDAVTVKMTGGEDCAKCHY